MSCDETGRDSNRHQSEVRENLERWERKPVIREVYRRFHELMAEHLTRDVPGHIVELGSGIGKIKEVIPECLCTDLFEHPWVDRVENAYSLSFADASVSNLLLFDVFHHFRYPGTALSELRRVLAPGGRAIVLEPCVSLLGLIVYGVFHDEPLQLSRPIDWLAPAEWNPANGDYYAAQGNAARVFLGRRFRERLDSWALVFTRKLSAISYVASGGYAKRQLYPDWALPAMWRIDRICDLMPTLFATRLLVVMERRD